MKLKKILYNFLPNSFKDGFKLLYYNAKIKHITFGFDKGFYKTKEGEKWEVITNRPLYHIIKDIERYEKYYKIKLNDIVIDAGANEGSLSVVYSQKTGLNGKVFAFEPDTKNILTMKHNVNLNKNSSNILLIEKALWSKSESIKFFEAGTVGSSVFYEDKNSKLKTIQATSIDDFIDEQNILRLDFVKMDIEGAEIEALKGCAKTIAKFKPSFAIASYHIVNGKQTYKSVEDFFIKIKYPFKTEFFDDGEIMTYAGYDLNSNLDV